MKIVSWPLALPAAALVFSVMAPARAAAVTSSAPTHPHVMVIIEENTAYNSSNGTPFAIGNSNAPYLNGLASQYASATQWFANEHNSPKDYYDLISGSNQAGQPQPYTATTLVDELATQGTSWKAYMEDAPTACYTGGGTGNYVKSHNPFISFNSIVNNPAQCQNVVPYTKSELSADLNSASPPAFVWITPNECNDWHSKCSPTNNAVKQGDVWLQTNLPAVLSSSWYTSGGVVIITFDESVISDTSGGTFGNGGHVATVVISANSHGAFNPSGDHFAVLRGIEETYGVGLLGGSANASFGDLKPAWAGTATTGTISGQVTDAQTGSPLGGATVGCATCPTTSTTTDVGGNYAFSNVPSGTYSLSYSATGYQPLNGVMVTVTAGGTTTQNEALTPTSHQPIFANGFESGDAPWTTMSGLKVENTTVHGGSFAAEGNVTGATAYARETLPATYSTAYERVWFNIATQKTQINVLDARTQGGSDIAFVYVSTNGLLHLKSGTTNTTYNSTTSVSTGAWHELEMSLVINGTSGSTQVWLDGAPVAPLSLSNVNLGTTPVGAMQIGSSSAQTWDVFFDDAAFDTQFIP